MLAVLQRRLFPVDIAIDLGTSKTAIYVKGEGVVLQEPSVISMGTARNGNPMVIATGEKAKLMLGKEPTYLKTIKPLQGGVIEHLEAAKAMLKEMGRMAGLQGRVAKPRVLIGAPHAISDIERRAVREAAGALNARSVFMIEEPVASAIGSGIDIGESVANMLVDIGSGITEVVIISLGGIVHSESVRVGGDSINAELISYSRRHLNLIIGEQTADFLKTHLCDLGEDVEDASISIKGTDVITRLPQTREVNAQDLRGAIQGPINIILNTIKRAFENTPPMLAGDLFDRGIVLSGGGALLKNLDKFIADAIQVPVTVAQDPLSCVVRGGGQALYEMKYIQRAMQ